jgi:hypothetical protein
MKTAVKYGGWLTATIATTLFLGAIASLSSLSVASSPTVELQTNPPLEEVIPNQTPATLTLKVLDAQRKPLPDANLSLQLLTPQKTPWLTSDFPIVEATTLLELKANAPAGELSFQQVLPIRGTYELKVHAIPTEAQAFEPFEQRLQFSVPENPVKYRNVAILAVILLSLGLLSGWAIGGKTATKPGEIAPQPVRLLLSGLILVAIAVLLWVNLSAEFASSHDHSSHDHSETPPAVQTSQGIEARLSGDTQATVGHLSTQTLQIKDVTTDKPISDLAFNLKVTALEDRRTMFAYQGVPDAQGEFTWQEQFFDGAPHQITVNIEPQANGVSASKPLQVSRQIEVMGIAPPLNVRLISLAYLTAIFVLGLFAGLRLRTWA